MILFQVNFRMWLLANSELRSVITVVIVVAGVAAVAAAAAAPNLL